MDCEKVRDRFSSFWEKELSLSEEEIFNEHLSSCPTCQREFEQFGKTMRWLHSAGEVEVPEGFLPELYKKIEEKKRAVPGQKLGGRRFHFPLSFKLPAQAVAMVAVVFLVLYLTKMIPTEGIRLKETKQTSSPLSVPEKPEGVLARPAPSSPISEGEVEKGPSGSTLSDRSPLVREAPPAEQSRGTGRGVEGVTQKEVKEERRALDTPTETPRPRDIEQAKAPVATEGRLEEASVPQTEAMRRQGTDSTEGAGRKVPSPEPAKVERELAGQEKALLASKPPQEIVLKISDREQGISQLRELVKQFGGEVVTAKADQFLVSLPTRSLSEFKKEVERLSSFSKRDQLIEKRDTTGSTRFEVESKREEVDQKSKKPERLAADTERRTIVRILLVEE